METSLLLNKNFAVVCVTNWKRVIPFIYLERKYVIDEEYRIYNFDARCELSKCMNEHSSSFVYAPKLKNCYS